MDYGRPTATAREESRTRIRAKPASTTRRSVPAAPRPACACPPHRWEQRRRSQGTLDPRPLAPALGAVAIRRTAEAHASYHCCPHHRVRGVGVEVQAVGELRDERRGPAYVVQVGPRLTRHTAASSSARCRPSCTGCDGGERHEVDVAPAGVEVGARGRPEQEEAAPAVPAAQFPERGACEEALLSMRRARTGCAGDGRGERARARTRRVNARIVAAHPERSTEAYDRLPTST